MKTDFMEPEAVVFADSARWIWGHPADAAYFPSNTFWKFRRDLEFASAPDRLRIRITASTRYHLYFNGEWVGEGPPPCDPAHQIVDEHDLAPFAKAGTNRLAVQVHHAGVPTFNYANAPGGLLAQVEWDGGVLATDASWWTARADEYNAHSHKRALQLVQSEIVDLRRREQAWMTGTPDPVGRQSNSFGAFWRPAFESARPGEGPWTAFVHRTIPYRRIEPPHAAIRLLRQAAVTPSPDPWDLTHLAKQIEREIPADAVAQGSLDATGLQTWELKAGEDRMLLFELGGYFCGQPFLEIESSAGVAVDVSLGEALFRGWVNPRYPKMLCANFTDRVVTANGRNEWRAFHWGAGRYLQLTLRGPGTVRLVRVGIVPSYYPLEPVGCFSSGDEMLDWLWSASAHTVRCCFHDQVTDCPTREQAQWVEHVSPQANWVAFGDPHLVRKMLIQVSESDLPGEPGCLRTPWPAAIPFQTRGGWTNLPDQQLVWIDLIRLHDEQFDDPALVRRLLPAVERVFGYHRRCRNEAGLLDTRKFPWGSWFWLDWEHRHKEGEIGSLNFFEAMGLRSGAVLARRAERPDLATRWEREADELARRAHDVFFDPARGLYCEDREHAVPSQIASVFAILAGACPEAEIDARLARVLEPPADTLIGGSHFYIYLLPLLARHGRVGEALDLIRRSYADMYAARVPVLWENFFLDPHIDPNPPPVMVATDEALNTACREDAATRRRQRSGESRCHAYSAAGQVFLSRWIAGIRPLTPGYAGVVIEPRVELLPACEATVPTPHGPVRVAWGPDPDQPGRRCVRWNAPDTVAVRVLPWCPRAPSVGSCAID